MACIDYLANVVGDLSGQQAADRRGKLKQAFSLIGDYEHMLATRLTEGLKRIHGINIHGVNDAHEIDSRFATFSITHDSIPTPHLATELGQQGIYVWAGNYYALQLTEQLGLEPEGMVRIGALHYNTVEEIDRLLSAIESAS